MLRWGVIPYLAKGIKVGFANINAKAESIDSKPAFRKSFERRPAGRQTNGPKSRPANSPMQSRSPIAASWRSPTCGRTGTHPAASGCRSFAIITTTPNELCGEIHNRMPVILKPESWPAWFGEEAADVPELKSVLAPYPRRHDLLAGQPAFGVSR
jgi:putative SOS response-associated peptidase YedK